MKVELHVPVEQYGFVAAELETDDAEKIRSVYDGIANAFKPKPINELPKKEWNAALDALNLGEPMSAETYERMSPKQKEFYHEQEKSLSRILNKETKPVIH